MGEDRKTLNRQIRIDMVEHIGGFVEKDGKTTGRDHFGRTTDLGLHAFNDPFHHSDIAPEDTAR